MGSLTETPFSPAKRISCCTAAVLNGEGGVTCDASTDRTVLHASRPENNSTKSRTNEEILLLTDPLRVVLPLRLWCFAFRLFRGWWFGVSTRSLIDQDIRKREGKREREEIRASRQPRSC